SERAEAVDCVHEEAQERIQGQEGPREGRGGARARARARGQATRAEEILGRLLQVLFEARRGLQDGRAHYADHRGRQDEGGRRSGSRADGVQGSGRRLHQLAPPPPLRRRPRRRRPRATAPPLACLACPLPSPPPHPSSQERGVGRGRHHRRRDRGLRLARHVLCLHGRARLRDGLCQHQVRGAKAALHRGAGRGDERPGQELCDGDLHRGNGGQRPVRLGRGPKDDRVRPPIHRGRQDEGGRRRGTRARRVQGKGRRLHQLERRVGRGRHDRPRDRNLRRARDVHAVRRRPRHGDGHREHQVRRREAGLHGGGGRGDGRTDRVLWDEALHVDLLRLCCLDCPSALTCSALLPKLPLRTGVCFWSTW
ncbi:hypothetical protein EMIHUDRAFT_442553, partial [Emiliania huxleyi CCMP1516]|uniref:Uncharacterized protein n=2 Tax=Emiliania huxleyi TaxID=2903 RepID=A0A0D3K3M8_EMIH1